VITDALNKFHGITC